MQLSIGVPSFQSFKGGMEDTVSTLRTSRALSFIAHSVIRPTEFFMGSSFLYSSKQFRDFCLPNQFQNRGKREEDSVKSLIQSVRGIVYFVIGYSLVFDAWEGNTVNSMFPPLKEKLYEGQSQVVPIGSGCTENTPGYTKAEGAWENFQYSLLDKEVLSINDIARNLTAQSKEIVHLKNAFQAQEQMLNRVQREARVLQTLMLGVIVTGLSLIGWEMRQMRRRIYTIEERPQLIGEVVREELATVLRNAAANNDRGN